MKKLFDLRFVIGIFFLAVGLLLLGYQLLGNTETGGSVNIWAGLLYLVFGAFMTMLSFSGKTQDGQ